MSSLVLQLAENGHANDYPFLNYSGTDIPANTLVTVDTTYYIHSSNVQDGIGVVPAAPAADGAMAIGVTLEIIKAGGAAGTPGTAGRVRCLGPIAVVAATGTVAIGASVMADHTNPGNVKTYTSALYQVGVALTAADTTLDQIYVMLFGAKGA
jgi:hypothetical protein